MLLLQSSHPQPRHAYTIREGVIRTATDSAAAGAPTEPRRRAAGVASAEARALGPSKMRPGTLIALRRPDDETASPEPVRIVPAPFTTPCAAPSSSRRWNLEDAIAERFGVSRTLVRTALGRLAA